MPHPTDGETDLSKVAEAVWFIQSKVDAASARVFQGAGARPLEDGVIGGVTGGMLVGGLRAAVPVAALLVSAQGPEGYPDHRAGAALIETLDRMMPELKIDTGPLRSQAETIEHALRAAMRQRPNAATAPPTPPDRGEGTMYQ